MSISPQSLARTRDKRSLRVPARFDDFSEIPPEMQYRSVAEALKAKGSKRSKKRHTFSLDSSSSNPPLKQPLTSTSSCSGGSVPYAANTAENSCLEDLKKSTPTASGPTSPNPANVSTTSSSSLSSSTTIVSVSSSATETDSPQKLNAKPPKTSVLQTFSTSHATTVLATTAITSPTCSTTSTALNTPPLLVIVTSPEKTNTTTSMTLGSTLLTQDDVVPTASTLIASQTRKSGANKQRSATYSKEQSSSSTDGKSPVQTDKDNGGSDNEVLAKYFRMLDSDSHESREDGDATIKKIKSIQISNTSQMNATTQQNLEKKAHERAKQNEKTPKITNNKEGKQKDNVIRKSPFHPSITISNSSKIKTVAKQDSAIVKPLIEKSDNPVDPKSRLSTFKTTSSRKKSQGYSLMVKQGINGTNISTNNNNSTTNNIGSNQNRSNPTQQTKFINNISQNLQYGPTRLLFNEPIYLPRTIAPIAPITATLQQIANQARKPPFISKKTEALIAYQEERKVDYLMSMHTALIKVLENLGPRDIANLRLVNRSWRSIADCESVWKSVTIKSGDVGDFDEFATRILSRYRTSELVFKDFVPQSMKATADAIENILMSETTAIKQVWLHTKTQMASRFAVILLEKVAKNEQSTKDIKIFWRPKVYVDDVGRALVPIGNENMNGMFEESDDLVEIDTIEASLDDLRTSQVSGYKSTIDIQPV